MLLGKFQLKILPKAGHAIHEDSPEEVIFANLLFFVLTNFGLLPTAIIKQLKCIAFNEKKKGSVILNFL